MSRTILNPEYANDLNGLFDGSGSIDAGSINSNTTITAEGNITTAANMECVSLNASGNITADGNIIADGNMECVSIAVSGELSTPLIGVYNPTTETDFINLTCPNSNILAIGNGSGTSAYNGELLCSAIGASGIITCATTGYVNSPTVALYLNETTTFVNLGCGGSNELTVGQSQSNGTITCGTVNATSYAGGIASLFVSSVAVAEIFAGTSIPYTYTIPNFVGNGTTTAYIVSSNLQTGVAPGSQSTYFVWSVSFNSATATDTTVNVLVSNVSTSTIGASTYNISIMAMN